MGKPESSDAEATHRADGQGWMLLVADDDADLRLYVRRCLLADPGLIRHVIEAPDGVEALKLARSRRPDIIACDVVMPRLDGLALCARIKADPLLSATPVLVFTGATGGAPLELQAREAGADAVLLKPFNARRLCSAIRALLSAPEASDRRSTAGSERPDPTPHDTETTQPREEP